MEKRRKREKNASNGTESNVTATLAFQQDHTKGHQQDLEHNKASGELPSNSAPWPFPGLQQQHQQQPITHQTSSASQAQETQQGAKAPPQAMPYWGPFSEFQGLPRPPYFTMPPGPPGPPPGAPAADSTWPPPSHSSSQVGSAGNPPPYGFPHPAWYSAYPPPYSGFYGYPLPANPSLHKGFIKPPQGLSQKHQKLWEVQSAENIQLWAALARVEAELAAQRSKITQLESDLQAVKINHETPAPAPAEAPVAPAPPIPQPAKRGRYRKPVVGNIPPEAIAPRPRGRKPANDKFKPKQQQQQQQSGETGTGLTNLNSPAPTVSTNSAPNGSFPSLKPATATTSAAQALDAAVKLNLLKSSSKENGAAARQLNGASGEKNSVGMTGNWSQQSQGATLRSASAAGSVGAGAAAVGNEDDEDEDEEDVVLAGKLLGLDPVVPNSQVRW